MSTRKDRLRLSAAKHRWVSFATWRITPALAAALALGMAGCDDDEDNPSGERDGTIVTDSAVIDARLPDVGRPDLAVDQGPDMAADLGPDLAVDMTVDMAVDMAVECVEDIDCNDENACTVDVCNAGVCANNLNAECCTRDLDCGPPGCIEAIQLCAQRGAEGIIISEVMLNPVNGGQWIEIHNGTDAPVRLNNWSLVVGTGEGATRHVITDATAGTGLVLPAGGYVILASRADAASPVAPAYVYGDVVLSAEAPIALLDATDAPVSSVSTLVLGALSPSAQGASIARSADRFGDAADDALAWCPSAEAWAEGTDLGSPAAANAVCPPRPEPVDFCRLQFPLDAEVFAGTEVTVYGRVFEAGVTDRTDATDANPRLLAEVGFGPDGSAPADNAEWAWVAAVPNPGWNAATAGEPGNDEYQATFTAATTGVFDHAYRFSADNGLTWTYCDRDAGEGSDGSVDGYQVANAGALTVAPSPCVEGACATPPAAICRENAVVGFEAVGTCTPVDAVNFECAYAELAPVACENDDICDAGACRAPGPFPAAGEVFITELMYDPHTPLLDNNAEWIELYNGTEGDLDLTGCLLQNQTGAGAPAGGPLTGVVGAGEYFLVGRSANPALNGGLTPDSVVPSINLGNNGTAVFLTCQGVEIDRVAYGTAAPWPPSGAAGAQYRSISLDPEQLSAAANDLGENWCLGSNVYLVDENPDRNHRGTPGAANPPCPVIDTEVDWCRLQFPLDVEAPAATALTVFGRVFEAGITDRSPATDTDEGLRAEVGYGPDASDPAENGDWTWFAAEANPAWVDGDEPGNDEYQGTFTVPAPGSYDFAYRFSRDGGSTWRYCDRAAGAGSDGAEDGYQIENAGALVSVGSPCEGVICDTPPADGCVEGGETLQTYQPQGTCEVVEGVAECRYVGDVVDCAVGGGTCEIDTCVFPVCEPNPCVTPPAADCADSTTRRTYAAVGTCTAPDGAAVCDYAAETFPCDAGETCAAGVCAAETAVPVAGEVFITELIYDPHTPLADNNAEWIELYNGSDRTLDLTGCLLRNQTGAANPAGGPLTGTVEPGAYFLVGRNADPALNGGLVLDSVVPGINLGNSGTSVFLTCGGAEIDRVTYTDAAPWPADAQFRSISLDRGAFDAAANDDGANWCYGRAVYFVGETPANDSRGTPGAENPPCAEPVDFCRLQFPLSIEEAPGASVTVYGRLYEAGVTDRSPANNAFQGIRGELGVGPDGSQAEGNDAWTWIAGVPNPAWDGTAAGAVDEDEYQADLVVPAAGRYDYAWRFTVDNGRTWTYCDGDAEGNTDGYQPESAGDLLSDGGVVVDPCDPNPCQVAPVADCADANTRRTFAAPGACTDNEGAPACEYAPILEACDAGFACEAGACVPVIDVCEPNPCVVPPVADCADADTRRTYAALGACTDEEGSAACVYAPVLEPCGDGFSCAAGACIADPNPCEPNPCLAPPVADCADADTRRTYAAPGACTHEAGSAACVYAPVLEPCGDGFSCAAGACIADPDPCEPNPCLAPPADDCVDAANRRSYVAPGACTVDGDSAACAYAPLVEACPADTACVEGTCEPVVDPCEPNPCVTPPADDCADGTTRRTYADLGACTAEGEAAACDYAAELIPCEADEICTEGVCAPPPARGPAAEEVFFTELMYRPKGELAAANAEWFELFNRTLDDLSLDGCTVFIAGQAAPIAPGLVIPARGYLLFARSADPALNGGLNPAGTFNVALPDNGTGMQLVCPAGTIDTIAYSNLAPWPANATGNSVSLNPANLTALGNNTAANWCYGRTLYYDRPGLANDHRGTPGAANPNCSETVDFCRLQFPLQIQGAPGTQAMIYGRIYEAGLTDLSTGNDPQQFIQMQFGFGPDASSPVGNNAAWTWFSGAPNAGYNGVDAGEPNNDEYEYRFTLPGEGRYDFAWRASVDGGRTWTYCDGGAAGSTNGYQPGSAGDLQVAAVANPCEPNPCNLPPANDCLDGDTRLTYAPVGVCTPNGGAASCDYAPTPVDCGVGEVCEAGACVVPPDPCEGVLCNSPPATECATGSSRRVFAAEGQCSDVGGDATCGYGFEDVPCGAGEACVGGLCIAIDACEGVICDQPPATECLNDTTTRRYAEVGQCDLSGGAPTCVYAPIDEPCEANETCALGVCAPAPDPCVGVVCDDVPAPTCIDASTLRTFGAGACEVDAGAPACVYPQQDAPCGAGFECLVDACVPVVVDPCEGVVCDAPPAADCLDATTRRFFNNGRCVADGEVGDCVYDEVSEDCAAGQFCNEGLCGAPITRAPQAGDLVFTEIMYRPSNDGGASYNLQGEWVELYNNSGAILDMTGCRVIHTGINGPTITSDQDVRIQPGAYFFAARTNNAGLYGGRAPNYVIGGGSGIGNNGSTVRIQCGSPAFVDLDTVVFTSTFLNGGWPNNPDRVSIALDPEVLAGADPHLANDTGSSWCFGRGLFHQVAGVATSDHRGTPGVANPACTKAVDFCRLQFPEDHAGAPNSSVVVYGRVYEQSVTDRTTATDTRPFVNVALGRGPGGSDPAGADWTWTAAVANPGWNAQQAGAGDEDEYQATLNLPGQPGDYDFAYRVSVDGGRSFTYCDRGAGSSDGYQPDAAGQLTVQDPCANIVCDQPPVDTCANETRKRSFANPGVCAAGTCNYAPIDTDCEAGFACNAGVCEPIVAFTTAEMEALFRNGANGCTGCHINGGSSGGWNFDGGLLPATVYVAAAQSALNRVEPGSRQNSYLFRKLAGTQAAVGSGSRMPLNGAAFSPVTLERVGLWIDGMTECGSGVLSLNKQCEDGNTENGDGCDAICSDELQTIINGAATIPSRIAAGAVDVFEFEADGPSLLNAKVIDAQGACVPDMDIILFGIDGNGDRQLLAIDDTVGDGCAELSVEALPGAGQYEIEIAGSAGQLVPAYVLEYGMAQQLVGPGSYPGDFAPGGSDFFVFGVGAPATVTLETTDGAGGCTADTVMTLFAADANGRAVQPLAENDDDGPGNCSRIVRLLGPGLYLANVRGKGPAGTYSLTYGF